MIHRLASLAAALLLAAGAARGQESGPAAPSLDLVQAALQAALAQRDQALADGIRASAQLTLARAEIARMRQDLAAAKKPPAEPEP